MTDRAIATVTDRDGYDGLIAAFRLRKSQLGLADLVLENVAGLAKGHIGKILGQGQSKHLGPVSLGALLFALGLKLLVVEDEDALRRVKEHFEQRNEKNVRSAAAHPAVELRFTRRYMRKLARRSVAARMQKLTRSKRSRLARRAARARWRQVRAAAARQKRREPERPRKPL